MENDKKKKAELDRGRGVAYRKRSAVLIKILPDSNIVKKPLQMWVEITEKI